MNLNRRNTKVLMISSLIALLGAQTAAADGHYTRFKDELDRCVNAARALTISPDTQKIRHFVRELDPRGVWAEFDIRTELYAETNGTATKAVNLRCRAHRWDDRTFVDAS